ncbi:MAG TPA: hypothetical protein ENN43_05855 [bacterium]|nr:hypothetical protein [bacterium]
MINIRVLSVFVIAIAVAAAGACGEKKVPSEPAVIEATAASTVEMGLSHTPTSTITACCDVTLTFTPTSTNEPGDTVTPTQTPVFTDTETPTATVTPHTGQEISCFEPKLYLDSVLKFPSIYPITSGGEITGRVHTHFSDVAVRVLVYNNSGMLEEAKDFITGEDGNVYGSFYTMSGDEEDYSTWHVAVMAQGTPASVYDPVNSSFYDRMDCILAENPPVPTPTAAHMDKQRVYLNMDRSINLEKYNFKLNSCNVIFFANHYCTEDAKILYYDGSDSLVYEEAAACSPQYTGRMDSYYIIQQGDAAGVWHIILYDPQQPSPAAKPDISDQYWLHPFGAVSFVVEDY